MLSMRRLGSRPSVQARMAQSDHGLSTRGTARLKLRRPSRGSFRAQGRRSQPEYEDGGLTSLAAAGHISSKVNNSVVPALASLWVLRTSRSPLAPWTRRHRRCCCCRRRCWRRALPVRSLASQGASPLPGGSGVEVVPGGLGVVVPGVRHIHQVDPLPLVRGQAGLQGGRAKTMSLSVCNSYSLQLTLAGWR